MATIIIEEWEGHEVTSSAIDVNIGSGLREAMRIAPQRFAPGDVIDIVARVRVLKISYEPSTKDSKTKDADTDGPYTRTHVGKALSAIALTVNEQGASTVSKILDRHEAALAKAKEIPGQQSTDELQADQDALADEEERLAAAEAAQ